MGDSSSGGSRGRGRIDQSGGTNSASALTLGRLATNIGTYNLSGTGTFEAGYVYVGTAGTGFFNQTGGAHQVGIGGLAIGYSAGSAGTYSLSSGQLSGDFIGVGYNGSGTFNQTGGVNSIGTELAAGYLCVGCYPGSAGTYNLSGGALILDELQIGYQSSGGTGTFTFNAPATLTVFGHLSLGADRKLAGNGTTAASINNSGGTISPGDSLGTLTVGSLTNASAGNVQIELGGTTPGTQYDRLVVSGAAALNGTLDVLLSGGFMPAAGDSFDILNWGSLSGTFSNLNLQSPGANLMWNTRNSIRMVCCASLWRATTTSMASLMPPTMLSAQNARPDRRPTRSRRQQQRPDRCGRPNRLAHHFGQTAGGGSSTVANATVPEPSTLVLLVLAATGVCSRRRRAA